MMLAHPGALDGDRLLAATKCLVAEWATDDYYVDEPSTRRCCRARHYLLIAADRI